MAISGVLTNVGLQAFAKGFVGTFGGQTIQNVCSYFVVGEGNAQIDNVLNEVFGTGNGIDRDFTYTVPAAETPLVRGSLVVVAGAVIATETDIGVLNGVGVTGTVEYKSGKVVLHYTNPVPAATNILGSFSFREGRNMPDASKTQLVAQGTPAATDPLLANKQAHLAWYKKSFGSDLLTFAEYVEVPSPRVVCHLFLDLPEFLDDGFAESPVIYECGVFDTEDQLIAYATHDKQKKDGASVYQHQATFVW